MLEQCFGNDRFLRNTLLDKTLNLKKGETIYGVIKDFLNNLKHFKKDNPFLKVSESSALQGTILRLKKAWKNRFENPAHFGVPKFKAKYFAKKSFKIQNNNNNIKILSTRKVKLAKLGIFRTDRQQLPEEATRIISATVMQDKVGDYFVSILYETEESDYKPTKINPKDLDETRAIGVDVGVSGIYTSTGKEYDTGIEKLKKIDEKIDKNNQRLSKKNPKSKNYRKLRIKTNRLYRKQTRIRDDNVKKIARVITKESQIVVSETLEVKEMLGIAGKKLSRSIANVSWDKFFLQLEYYANQFGVEYIQANTYFPSSQKCSACGKKNPEVKDLSVREWTCPHCKTYHHRDFNACQNLKQYGIRYINNRCGMGTILEPECESTKIYALKPCDGILLLPAPGIGETHSL